MADPVAGSGCKAGGRFCCQPATDRTDRAVAREREGRFFRRDRSASHQRSGPGLYCQEANAALAGFDKQPDAIVRLLDAAATAKEEGKSLVLASDHIGAAEIGVRLMVAGRHAELNLTTATREPRNHRGVLSKEGGGNGLRSGNSPATDSDLLTRPYAIPEFRLAALTSAPRCRTSLFPACGQRIASEPARSGPGDAHRAKSNSLEAQVPNVP